MLWPHCLYSPRQRFTVSCGSLSLNINPLQNSPKYVGHLVSRAQGRRLRAVDVKRLQEASTPPFDAKKLAPIRGDGGAFANAALRANLGDPRTHPRLKK